MIAYLDTNVVIWLAQGNLNRISPKAKDAMEKADLLISPMVLIELEYLYEIQRIKLPSRDVQRKVAYEIGVRVCDLPFPSVANTAIDEKWTRDPFDRFIVAQAKANGFAFLVSADDEIAEHYPRTLW
ncbi:MAG: type II toxin-antitoxin system VapC family toxin [Acidobacteriaceae bacterium]